MDGIPLAAPVRPVGPVGPKKPGGSGVAAPSSRGGVTGVERAKPTGDKPRRRGSPRPGPEPPPDGQRLDLTA